MSQHVQNTDAIMANIWKLIDVIKREEDISRVKVVHIQQGRAPTTPNPVYARVNAQVSTVVGDYANRVPLDYLRSIAYSITVYLSYCFVIYHLQFVIYIRRISPFFIY